MKILCIGRNYADHAKEMGSAVPSEPMVFMKPPSALLIKNRHFFIPDFSDDIHYEGEIVLKIGRNGRSVQSEYAASYIEGIGFGIDFTARDLQRRCKEMGHPWEIAKSFDKSAAVSEFIAAEDYDLKNIDIKTRLNGDIVQHASSADLIFDFETIITHVSRYFTLQMGDLIFTGTPAGVGSVQIGDKIDGYLNDEHMLTCEIH